MAERPQLFRTANRRQGGSGAWIGALLPVSVLAQPAFARILGVAGVLVGLWLAVLWAVSIA